MSLNKGEIGAVIRVQAGEDISSATSVLILAQPEIGTLKEFVATVPNSDITINGELFTANEYAQFTTTTVDDLDYAGRWRFKLESTFSPSDIRQTNYTKIRVLD